MSSSSAEGERGKPSPPSKIGVVTFSETPLMELQAWCYKDSMYRKVGLEKGALFLWLSARLIPLVKEKWI